MTESRKVLLKFPRSWIDEYIDAAVAEVLDIKNDYFYRRLLDLLEEVSPGKLHDYLNWGLASEEADLVETAEEYKLYMAKKSAPLCWVAGNPKLGPDSASAK